jgi:hypothetical protein
MAMCLRVICREFPQDTASMPDKPAKIPGNLHCRMPWNRPLISTGKTLGGIFFIILSY